MLNTKTILLFSLFFLFVFQVGNSSYGKTLTDQEGHRKVKFCRETKASQLIKTPFFRQIEQIDEVARKLLLNLPLKIGFFVYQHTKLRMLQFDFDFLNKYLGQSDFQYCETDTDSTFIVLLGSSVESLVKPELKQEFVRDKSKWFPTTNSPDQKAYDKRTPRLFKEEWSGQGIIGQNSKTSYDKFSCKGINKRFSEIKKENCISVLLTRQNNSGINKAFHVIDSSMYTYGQVCDGFSYFYPKR